MLSSPSSSTITVSFHRLCNLCRCSCAVVRRGGSSASPAGFERKHSPSASFRLPACYWWQGLPDECGYAVANRLADAFATAKRSDMPPSFTSRPRSGESRPASRADDENLVIPNRTSSLHSRITQPMPGTMNGPKPGQRAPKTLTHAYMVCGVGREPSQWVKAPTPPQGKIGHMKGAVGQFWLPEILGSSPRLEQDNEIARSLHAAMRVRYVGRNH